jgi:hypothetical protein
LLSNVKRLLLISLALVFPLVAGLSASEQKSRKHRNRPPAINSFTSSAERIPICEFSPDSNRPEVDLFVNATDPTVHYDRKLLHENHLVIHFPIRHFLLG